jgi:hypothetical protein
MASCNRHRGDTMKREVFEVIEAARGLQVQLAPGPANPHCVRIGGERSEFPERLWRLAVAVEAFDRSGSSAMDEDGRDATMDAAKLKVALDSVFRWMRSTGLDVSEPFALVSQAMGPQDAQPRTAKAYRPVPRFAPNGFRKPVRHKPLLNLDPVLGERISMEKLAEKELRAQMTDNSLGAASTTSRTSR